MLIDQVRLRTAAVVASVVGLLAGCTAGGLAQQPQQSSVESASQMLHPADVTFDLRLDAHASTVVYFLAGPHVTSYDVYRFHPATGSVDRLTRSRPRFGVSFMSATVETVVMADASTGTDALVVLDDDGTTPLPDEPPEGRGFAPDLSPDGRLVYTRHRADRSPGGSGFEVVVRDAAAGEPRVVFTHPSEIAAVWGPEGSVVVRLFPGRDSPGASAEVIQLDPSTGNVRLSRRSPLDRSANLVGHPDSRYVVVNDPGSGAAAMLDLARERWVSLPQGWVGCASIPPGSSCWPPAGASWHSFLSMILDGHGSWVRSAGVPSAAARG